MSDIATLSRDPCELAKLSVDELFSIDQESIDVIQLSGLQRRFCELVPYLPPLKALADENHIAELNEIHDVVPLLFPHTEYKSYPLSLIDNGRFEQLNEWLNDYTLHDLSGLDLGDCQSLDDWLDVVEKHTSVRVVTSSGTSGKITLLPRSTTENQRFAREYFLGYAKFGSEAGLSDPYGSDVYHVQFNPRHGRMAGCRSSWIRIDFGFGGDGTHVLTMDGNLSTDVLWMTGRLRKAQADGMLEQLKRTKAWKTLTERFGEMETARVRPGDDFYLRVITELRGKKVAMAGGLTFYGDMLACAERHGLEISFHPDSSPMTAGGLKGVGSLTPAQIENIETSFPHRLGEFYGCSELMALARRCAVGNFHMPPSIVSFVLDPDTGAPYPRKGVQTGRYAAFDLWAETYWGGFITGDEVTMNWYGGCDCGRSGPYLHSGISRYADSRGGDDKISCQRTAAAVEEMMRNMRDSAG